MWLWQKCDTCVAIWSQLVTGPQIAKVFDTVFRLLSLPLQRSTESFNSYHPVLISFSTKSISALHLLYLFAIYTAFSTLDVYLLHKSFHKHTRYAYSRCPVTIAITTTITATISKGSWSCCSGLGFWLWIVVHFSKVFLPILARSLASLGHLRNVISFEGSSNIRLGGFTLAHKVRK